MHSDKENKANQLLVWFDIVGDSVIDNNRAIVTLVVTTAVALT